MIKICFQENERKIFSSFQLYARAYVRIWTLRTWRLVKLSPYSPGSLTLVGFVPGSNPPSPPPRNSLALTLLLPLPFSHTYRRTLYPLYLLLLARLLGWTDRYNTGNLPVISTAIRCVLNTEMKHLPDPGLNSVFTVVSFSCFRQMSVLKNLTCLLLGIFYETTLWWVRRWKIGTERSNKRKAKIKSSRT